MDIKKQRQNYDALQKARAELVRVAVEGIVTNLEGLDLDVCGEILTKSYKRLAGRVMPKGHSGLSAETAESAEKAAENARKAQAGLYHRFGHKGASSRGEGLAKTWGHTGL
jgi:hypothetical protein